MVKKRIKIKFDLNTIQKKIANPKGLTLVELIVSTFLIGIVMIGVVAFSLTIKQIQDATNKSSILKVRSMAFISHFSKKALLATGSQTNPGIRISPTSDWISFREDRNNTPNNYSDDWWNIYMRGFYDGAGTYADPWGIHYCTHQDTGAIDDYDPEGNALVDCASSSPNPNTILLFPHLQTGLSNWEVQTPGQYVRLKINAQYDPENPTSHPVDNPTVKTGIMVSPPSQSW